MKVAKYTRNPVEINYGLKSFPYFVLNQEETRTKESGYITTDIADYRKEIREIKQYYLDYTKGATFQTEGTGGNYVASDTSFKTIRTLIKKEARFMFSQTPDITIKPVLSDEDENETNMIEQYQRMFNQIMEDSAFPKRLLIGAKDCLIGKRIACVADIDETGKILIHFYNSLQFYYELRPGTDELKKIITFEQVGNLFSKTKASRFLVNRYEQTQSGVLFSSVLYDSAGNVLETLVPETTTELEYIPAVVITNDDVLEDRVGVSDVEFLSDYESIYSKIANGDIDADRQNMNPVRYVVDMNSNTTKNLSNAAGSFWDLKSEQNQNEVHPQVGTLAPTMQHSEPVKTTLERIRSAMYGEVDVPDISQDGLLSGITSFKALKALYYPLTVVCNERMNTWKPAIKKLVKMCIDLAMLNKQSVQTYYTIQSLQEIQYKVMVSENYALLDDENEEKATDINEVMNNIRSRKSYNKKWRADEFDTDQKLDEELLQIAVENNMFDTLSSNPSVSSEISRRYGEQQIDEGIALEGAKTELGDDGGTEAE